MTPEFIALQCDHCPNAITEGTEPYLVRTSEWGGEFEPVFFQNHSEAYREAKKLGWYIADVELCPECAEHYAVEKTSQEEVKP